MLTAPSPRAAPPRALELRPRQCKAWIESLPLAHALEAGTKLREHLTAMNAVKVETDDRLQILGHYHPVAGVVLDELDAIYSKSAVPLSSRAREALALARGLAMELAAAHAIVVSEKMGRLIAFGAKKQAPSILYRTLEYLSASLRASYKSYTPVPEGLWRRIHEVYLYADAEKLAAEPADPESKASVADLYAECLLLALTDPYRLPGGELDRIVKQVRAVRVAPALGRSTPATPPGGHFLVPCDTDKPPKPALSANDERGGPNWRMLDTHPLVERLRARKDAHERGQVSAASSKAMTPEGLALVGRLVTLWGDPPKRASRRDPVETSVAICVGLKAASHYVSLEPRHDAEREAELIHRGITIPLITVLHDSASAEFPVNEWEVINQSRGGLKVRRTSSSLQPVAVGEVIGVKLIGRARWTIGVVRWITVVESGGVECGIQFLSPAARTVSLQPTITSAANQVRLALLLNESGEAEESTSLLAPISTFADLREFELEDGETISCVRATNLLEKTARYERFVFRSS